MGVPERGDHVISKMQTAIDEIRTACATAAIKPHVFCEEWGKPLIASQPWVAELIEVAGGTLRRRARQNYLGRRSRPILSRRSTRSLVRRRQSRPTRKDSRPARMEQSASSSLSPRLLHQRRTPQHSRQQPRPRTPRHRLGATPRSLSPATRNQATGRAVIK